MAGILFPRRYSYASADKNCMLCVPLEWEENRYEVCSNKQLEMTKKKVGRKGGMDG